MTIGQEVESLVEKNVDRFPEADFTASMVSCCGRVEVRLQVKRTFMTYLGFTFDLADGSSAKCCEAATR